MKTNQILFFIMILAIISLVSCTEVRTVASYNEIIECTNWIFDCDYEDCRDQCGAYASSINDRLVDSEPINSGSACSCKISPIA